jgi:glucan 1,3-beta-glucosidase
MSSLRAVLILCGLVIALAARAAAISCGLEHVQAKIRRGDVRVRSVNLGAWLVSEYWMSYESPLYAGLPVNEVAKVGEYAIMKKLGLQAGTAAFQRHRDTWINETHIAAIAATGLNTVRVPVGFWIVCDDDSTSYEFGSRSGCVRDPSITTSDLQINKYARGSLAYLDRLINDWAVKYNVAVMLSLHAHQGSQNGYEHSGTTALETFTWTSNTANRDNSVNFASFLARRYKNSAAFLGMNVINEPRLDYNLNYAVQQQFLRTYYESVYSAIRGDGNDCVIAVSPLIQEQDASHLAGLMDDGKYTNVWHELHTYFIWGYEGVSETEILRLVDVFRDQTLIPASKNANNRMFIGEWCMGGPPNEEGIFSNMDNFRELGRKQLALYNQYPTGGWAFWSWRHSHDSVGKLTGWSMRALLQSGDLVLTL